MQNTRRESTYRPGEEDLASIRAESFVGWDLADPALLSQAMQLLARDSRRRIMQKVRRA